jgi:hypothetical protein
MFPRRGIKIFRSVLGNCDGVMVMNPVVVVQPRFDLRPVPSTPNLLHRREAPQLSFANDSPESVPAQPRIDKGVQFTIGNVQRQNRRSFLRRHVSGIDPMSDFRCAGRHARSLEPGAKATDNPASTGWIFPTCKIDLLTTPTTPPHPLERWWWGWFLGAHFPTFPTSPVEVVGKVRFPAEDSAQV